MVYTLVVFCANEKRVVKQCNLYLTYRITIAASVTIEAKKEISDFLSPNLTVEVFTKMFR